MGPRCAPHVAEITSSSDSAVLLLTSTSVSCEFTATINSSSPPGIFHCELHGENSSLFICHINNLEPGTLYQLTVTSRKDGGQSNTFMWTGKTGRLFSYIHPYQRRNCMLQSKSKQSKTNEQVHYCKYALDRTKSWLKNTVQTQISMQTFEFEKKILQEKYQRSFTQTISLLGNNTKTTNI